ncbi:MAG: FAD-binding oxidoreductase [Desulfobacteraceae bacterium]|nr:FAD-binding oxidoreductase [Desulfobacteraceae bacterium]
METYDVVIIGGAVMGSSIAYFLSNNPDFDGKILVVEKDPTYAQSSTSLSAGGIRQQFSNTENIQISQFGASFLKNIDSYLQFDDDPISIDFTEKGYLFLATKKGIPVLQKNHETQRAVGASVQILNQSQLKEKFDWLNVDDLEAGSYGYEDAGWFDPHCLTMAFKNKAKTLGVEYLKEEVVEIQRTGQQIIGIKLSSGEKINAGIVINASGTKASNIAKMAGIQDLPVHSRKRFIFLFKCLTQLPDCPLVVDPSGAYFRPEGQNYICGISPSEENDPDCDDFYMDYSVFEEQLWPILAQRVPAFDAIKRISSWAGHYAYNVKDQNAILGIHPEVNNFILANGFSGHGLQQAPGVGRAVSELVTYGQYRTLDLSCFAFERFADNNLYQELNVV